MITVISVYMHTLLKQFAMPYFPIVALTLANYTDLNVLANLHIARMCHHLFYDLCIFKRLLCFWDYINRWLTTILNLLSYWTYYQTFTWLDTIFVFFVSKSQRNQSRNQITNKFVFFNDQEWSYYFVANTTDISNAK